MNIIRTGASAKKYAFNKSKAEEIYTKTKELVPVFPKNEITKHIIRQAIDQLNSTSVTVETIRTLMNETASKLPEYSIVMQFKGIGPSLGPQLMAEIGDVTRFTHKGALTAFAGVDPGGKRIWFLCTKKRPNIQTWIFKFKKDSFSSNGCSYQNHASG